MSELLRPIVALLLSAAILLMGNGLLTLLVPIRAEIEAFTAIEIGLVGATYFGGLLAGCFLCPAAVSRVGHVRAFTAFTAVATIAPLMHAMTADPVVWWVLRFLTGICVAGITMVIESWLNGASSNESRGSVLSIYTVINLTVVAVGQMMILLGDPALFQLFSLVAILISLAAVPVALSRAPTPQVPPRARLRLGKLYRVSPVALAGCLATGLANGAFWSLGPVFAARAGLAADDIAIFMTAAVIGGAALQWPSGFLSDRVDRRRVVLVHGAVAVAAGGLLSVGAGAPPPAMTGLGLLYGAASIPIYALSVAHANDFATREEAVDVSSGLLLAYSVGAVVGPLLASASIGLWGAWTLFVFTAATHALLCGFVLYRLRAGRTPPPETRDEFVAVPRTSPAVFGLDPRGAEAPPDAPPPPAGTAK